MTDKNVNVNTETGQGKRKKIIALALVLVVLIGIAAGILIARDNIMFNVALEYAAQKDFASAEEYAEKVNTKKGKYLQNSVKTHIYIVYISCQLNAEIISVFVKITAGFKPLAKQLLVKIGKKLRIMLINILP